MADTIDRLKDLKDMTDSKEIKKLADIMIDFVKQEGKVEAGFSDRLKKKGKSKP